MSNMKRPQRIQLSRRKGFNLQEHSRALNGLEAVKVDRATKWGNPFRVCEGKDNTGLFFTCDSITDCLIRYREYEERRYDVMSEALRVGFDPYRDIRGKNLACYCQLDVPCHADILLELANSIEVR